MGFLLRVHKLSDIPHGFFADEASIGYNAYTILTKGTDEYGTRFAVFFRAFGEYKSPIQIYATVPFVAIFGLNEFSVRLPSAIFGTLTIIVVYLLTKELFSHLSPHHSGVADTPRNDKVIPLLAALFLAVSPWHIHFSRTSLEGQTVFIFFTTLGLYFFIKSQYNTKFLFLSVIAFGFSLYCYFPARIFIPLFGLFFIILYAKFFLQNKKLATLNSVLFLLLLMPLILHTVLPSGLTRWNQVNIFSQPPKDVSIPSHVIHSYLSHFSLDFLFLKGDIDIPGQFITRHSVRGMGELYFFQLPLVLAGIFNLLRKKEKQKNILLFWLLLYPIGSMFTIDKNAQATRSIIGVIPFQIISAIGLFYSRNILFKCFKTFKQGGLVSISSMSIIVLVIFFYFINFLQLYFIKYPLYSSDFWGWQYGPREIMKYFLTTKNEYDDLYMSGEFNGGEIFIKFYDPKNFCHNKCNIGDFWREPNIYNPKRRQLYSLSPEYLNKSKFGKKFVVKKTVYYPNKTIAFQIGEIVQ